MCAFRATLISSSARPASPFSLTAASGMVAGGIAGGPNRARHTGSRESPETKQETVRWWRSFVPVVGRRGRVECCVPVHEASRNDFQNAGFGWPSPPRLFIPKAAIPRRSSSGSTCCSKLRYVLSKQLGGIWNPRHARACGLLYLAPDTFVSRFTLSECQ